MKKKLLIASILAVTLCSTALRAMNGVTPIWEPTTITEPGHYMLTRNITVTDTNAIVIQTGGVTLDLNGFTIHNAGTVGAPVVVEGTPLPDPPNIVWIHNGRIVGGQHGVSVAPNLEPPPVRLSRVEISGSSSHGIFVPVPPNRVADFDVVDVLVHDVLGDGIRIEGAGTVGIENSLIRDVGGDGIRVTGSSCPCNLSDNKLVDIAGNGIFFNADGGPGGILGNTISTFGTGGNQAAGIHIDGSGQIFPRPRIIGNVITAGGAQSTGAILNVAGAIAPVEFRRNNIGEVGAHGIELASGSARITGNEIGGVGGDGIYIAGDYALVESNRIIGSTVGINFANGNGHAYRDNFTRDNANGGIVDQFNNTDAGGNIQ